MRQYHYPPLNAGWRWIKSGAAWLERIDPGGHRRIKGLRLVTAYGLGWMMGSLQGMALQLPGRLSLGALAAGYALWASVSEGRLTRTASSRDLAFLVLAAMGGSAMMMFLTPILVAMGQAGPEFTLVTGAFLVGYLKCLGILGAGVGSQIFIGQLLAYGARLVPDDFPMVILAGFIAAGAAIVPRLLSGPAERPAVTSALAYDPALGRQMGLQAAIAALAIVLLNDWIGLEKSAWAITACTYVISGTATGTMERVFRRVIGTALGVPLGLACLPFAVRFPVLTWTAAALALIIYAMALPDRYDIACGSYAFALILTLADQGESSVPMLFSRAWETLIGGAFGLTAALLILPFRRSTPLTPPGNTGGR